MLNIEDLLEYDYKITIEQETGIISHLHSLCFIDSDSHHEGQITITRPQASRLLDHANQIAKACEYLLAKKSN